LRDRACEETNPAGDAEHKQHDAEHYSGGGNLARPKPAGQDHGRNGLHRLHRQRQPIEQARADQEERETKEHPRRSQTRDSHCPDPMGDKGAEIAASAAVLQE
jgi:hypothetical protein